MKDFHQQEGIDMKRIIKSMLSALLITALLISLLTISAGAALPPALVGDVNCDDSVDILDVTLIERYLIDNVVFVDNQKVVADYDRDGDISVIDATWIQRKILAMPMPGYINSRFCHHYSPYMYPGYYPVFGYYPGCYPGYFPVH